MEGNKRKKGSNKKGGDSSSSEDDNSLHHNRGSGDQRGRNQVGEGALYSAHIASVCNELNAAAERSMSPFEKLMLQKRRETNRLSARRCRKQRKEEIQRLEGEQRRLGLESQQLIAENTRLKAVLQTEISTGSNHVDGTHFQLHLPFAQQENRLQEFPRLLQHQPMHRPMFPFIPSSLTPADISFVSQARLMPETLTAIEQVLCQQLAASGGGMMLPITHPQEPSLDVLAYLSRLNGIQEPSNACSAIQAQSSASQPLPASRAKLESQRDIESLRKTAATQIVAHADSTQERTSEELNSKEEK